MLIARKAAELFYQHGVAEISVEDILACSGASRGTFYKYFADKQDVVGAALEYRDEEFRDFISRMTPVADSAEHYLNALFAALLTWQREQGAHGCLFQSAFSQYQQSSERIKAAAIAHKKAFTLDLEQKLTASGVTQPNQAAVRVNLLIEGALALGHFGEPETCLHQARDAAVALVTRSRGNKA
ncbi:TetR family transcriptional regulator [Salmonella enterica subsp. enterica serovar Choleraesuis]|nr:TetR family transcriptional regulator [Salmonella enterica subsp. enterica serovar Choleraesuis]